MWMRRIATVGTSWLALCSLISVLANVQIAVAATMITPTVSYAKRCASTTFEHIEIRQIPIDNEHNTTILDGVLYAIRYVSIQSAPISMHINVGTGLRDTVFVPFAKLYDCAVFTDGLNYLNSNSEPYIMRRSRPVILYKDGEFWINTHKILHSRCVEPNISAQLLSCGSLCDSKGTLGNTSLPPSVTGSHGGSQSSQSDQSYIGDREVVRSFGVFSRVLCGDSRSILKAHIFAPLLFVIIWVCIGLGGFLISERPKLGIALAVFGFALLIVTIYEITVGPC